LDNGTDLLRLRSLFAISAWITDFRPEEGMEKTAASRVFL
jgi:hypothetical protein